MYRGTTLLVTVLLAASPATAGLAELARAGQWRQLLAVAVVRADQLPLSREEAFVAAVAARSLGDPDAEASYLRRAAADGPLAGLAGVELARLVVASDPGRAIELALPSLRRGETPELRAAAAELAAAAVSRGADAGARAGVESVLGGLPSSIRRTLELALATTDDQQRRLRLGRLLAASSRDLVALEAARQLEREPDLGDEERWWVVQALYRHAQYADAEPLLERLLSSRHPRVPAWEVAFLRGRCAFRRGAWDEAASWYATALAHAGGGERAADVEVHRARALELGGRLDEALAAAQRAVRLRTTDERRLFLARLRLRRGEPELAASGIARLRDRSARDRGRLLVGLDHLAHGRRDDARQALGEIRRPPWQGPAAVLTAELALADGDPAGAVAILERSALAVDPYWAERARDLMSSLPEATLVAFRERQLAELAAAAGDRDRRRALATWATLEPDQETVAALTSRVAEAVGLDGEPQRPDFPPGLADELWRLGLEGEAARWDPAGLPRRDARETLWTAQQLLARGAPRPAIVAADAAWRQADAAIPVRAYPGTLQRALYPLPEPAMVWRAALASGVPWSLLAAVAREESRWQPDALSRAGARGLLQLMPGTAADVADRLGRPPVGDDELFDMHLSLELGGAELRRLLEVFGGRWAPAIAAYNAGEAQARLWLDQCGAGCDEIAFVANISFTVTRTYTTDVLAAATTYAGLYGATLERAGEGDQTATPGLSRSPAATR